jgi:amino acid transporter
MLLAGVSVDDATSDLATLASFGFLLAYTVVSLSTPRFLRRIGELTTPTALAGPAAAAVMGTTFALYASPLLSDSQHYVTWVFLGLVAAGMGWYSLVSIRTPAAIDEVGVWDRPMADDLYDPAHLVSGMR